MTKRKIQVMAVIASLFIFSACGNQNLVTDLPADTETTKDSVGETYGFTVFNVAIDTKEMKQALVASYDEKIDKTEASYENKIENLYLHGNAAMEKLDEIFSELTIEPDMDAEDLIKKTSEAFEVIDYKTLKLTIKFKGYDTKELMMTK